MHVSEDYIKSLGVAVNTSARFDCPSCKRRNTLSVTNTNGNLKWLCFYARCKVRGRAHTHLQASDIRNRLDARESELTFEIPDHWTSAMGRESVVRYLTANNCMAAYGLGKVRVRYDPKEDRVVFLIHDSNGVVVDAAGRTLSKDLKPKWRRYGSSGHPFICGDSDVGVVVEDCPSACAVSHCATGISLLGTSVQGSHKSILKRFSRLIIALDKDATRKSIAIHRELSYYVPSSVVMLDDDLKYASPEQVQRILGDV